jgi:hypothetical protein
MTLTQHYAGVPEHIAGSSAIQTLLHQYNVDLVGDQPLGYEQAFLLFFRPVRVRQYPLFFDITAVAVHPDQGEKRGLPEMRADGSGLVAKRDCITNVGRDGGLGVNQHPLDMGYGRTDILLDALCGGLRLSESHDTQPDSCFDEDKTAGIAPRDPFDLGHGRLGFDNSAQVQQRFAIQGRIQQYAHGIGEQIPARLYDRGYDEQGYDPIDREVQPIRQQGSEYQSGREHMDPIFFGICDQGW